MNLEWDMKLWWAHNEAMIALAMAYKASKDKKHWDLFKLVTDYSYEKAYQCWRFSSRQRKIISYVSVCG